MTEVVGAPGAATEFQPNTSTGVITFHAGAAGFSVRIWYQANLTVAQSRQKFYQRNINNQAGALFNTVAVGGGVGELYTSEYDTNVDWSTAVPGNTGVIMSGPDGILTIGGGGTAIPGARVVHVPNPDNAMLGISFNLTP
jgi:hypothetical protein